MLKALVLSVLITALTALYVLNKLSGAFNIPVSRFEKFINLYWMLTAGHALHIFLVRQFFPNRLYFDEAAPYGMLYGPLIYFGLTLALEKPLQKKQLIHLLPGLIVTVFYLLFVFLPDFREEYKVLYFKILYTSVPLSLIGYAVWGTLTMGGLGKKAFEEAIYLFASVSMLLILVAFLYLMVMYTKVVPVEKGVTSNVPAFIIYAVMQAGVFLTFYFRINRLVIVIKELAKQPEKVISKEALPYHKSAIPLETLDSYQQKLTQAMEEGHLYLDKDLSLPLLAKKLKIPKHHLTQLFSLRIDKNFHHYINDLRIAYACKLLKKEAKDLTIEEIATKSGFNSKVSFNRHFKSSIGCTPSEYKVKNI